MSEPTMRALTMAAIFVVTALIGPTLSDNPRVRRWQWAGLIAGLVALWVVP